MADRKIADLFRDIQGDVRALLIDQAELAKAELQPAAKNAGIAGGLFGSAGYFAINAALLLYIAAGLGLIALGVAPWLAFVIVAVALALTALILALVGRSRVRQIKPPVRTIANAQALADELKASIQEATAAANAARISAVILEDKKALK